MDDESLREMMEKNHTSAFGWALYCCHGDREEAADVLHSAYIQILEKGTQAFSGKSSFKTWLFSVIRNTAKKRHFQLGRRLRKLQQVFFNPSAEGQKIEQEFYRNELRNRILDLLDILSNRQRQVLQLVFYHNLTLEEAAGVMKVSVGSARTHYERGKSRLRAEMKKGEWDHGK
jgi:RNA polymerase sigma-70 factor (ECF subfamily)